MSEFRLKTAQCCQATMWGHRSINTACAHQGEQSVSSPSSRGVMGKQMWWCILWRNGATHDMWLVQSHTRGNGWLITEQVGPAERLLDVRLQIIRCNIKQNSPRTGRSTVTQGEDENQGSLSARLQAKYSMFFVLIILILIKYNGYDIDKWDIWYTYKYVTQKQTLNNHKEMQKNQKETQNHH